jgi:hypothetical protein
VPGFKPTANGDFSVPTDNFRKKNEVTMSPYNSSGTLQDEDIRLRNLARARISEALAKEEQRTTQLVQILVARIEAREVPNRTPDQLWQTIQAHESLRPYQTKIDANTGDYPSLRETVIAARQRIERQQKSRLARALQPIVEQARFANTRWL